jgi:hypothetical protein
LVDNLLEARQFDRGNLDTADEAITLNAKQKLGHFDSLEPVFFVPDRWPDSEF